jgi:hypothetical protein
MITLGGGGGCKLLGLMGRVESVRLYAFPFLLCLLLSGEREKVLLDYRLKNRGYHRCIWALFV